MKALYFDGSGFDVRELKRPIPGPGEALIRVRLAGVCRTDVEIARGYMGFIGVPGHEFVGVVEDCEDKDLLGKRVVGEINVACGACGFCRRGLERHCPHRSVLGIQEKDGAFAEFITLPKKNLHVVPDAVSDRAAVFVEPLAACFEIVRQVELAGKKVLVLGDGKLGILAARVLAGESGVTIAGKHADKLALARSGRVRTVMVDELLDEVSDPEGRFDVVVEATGRADGFGAALGAVRPRGVIVQKTAGADSPGVDLARLVIDEVTVVGSRCGPFEPAIDAIASGRVEVEDLVEASYPLSEGPRAIEAAMAPGSMKVLIEI